MSPSTLPTRDGEPARTGGGDAGGPTHPAPPSSTWRMLAAGGGADEKLPRGLDAAWDAAVARVQSVVPRRRRVLRRAERILSMEDEIRTRRDAALREELHGLRERFRRQRDTREDVDRAFALIREVAHRRVGLRPFREQTAAALAILEGSVTEMATGEGKTLAATLPATVAGWRGRGCHIITVNDYLAQRDAEWMGPIYRFCGLRVAAVTAESDRAQRRDGYAADVTYCTNKEVAADFLRDRLSLGSVRDLSGALLDRITEGQPRDDLLLRGREFAIVDEADSVLVDEAVTPLIISGSSGNAQQTDAFERAAEIADELSGRQDYRVDGRFREVRLTSEGKERVDELAQPDGGLWRGSRRREELVTQALSARELFDRGTHYVVQDGKVVIVDEFTGRLMPDRTWRDGLHQAVEAKEGLEIQPPKETLSRISFQRFFRGYKHLAGMTGTAWEARHELWQIYHLPVVRIPTHHPCIRQELPDRIYPTAEEKFAAVVDEIQRAHDAGRPVLVGTRSVDVSERVSRLLHERGLDHAVLNAVQHEEEARIIAEAGQPDRITVATNMAGRGTDISLGRGVAERGGLHVVATERHEARRIDRQLFGRAGRQGDPGTAVAYVSLEDELVRRHATTLERRRGWRRQAIFDRAQRRAERMALNQRRNVLRTDHWLDESLGFAPRE